MILSTMINQYLAQDPEVSAKLAEHEGKILKIEFLDVNFMNINSFFIFIHQNSISLSFKGTFSPDATVRGTPLNLLALGLSKNNVIPENIEITGDVLFLNNIKNIFKEIDINWAEILSKFTGNHIAYAASQVCAKLNYFKNQASQNIGRDLREYLQEEYRYLVPRTELEDFYKNIDHLRDDVERLHARVEMISS